MKKTLSFFMFLAIAFGMLKAQNLEIAVVANSDGCYNQYAPICGYYVDEYMRSQTIYPASMLTELVGKEIHGLRYYIVTPVSEVMEGTFETLIGVVEEQSFDVPWSSVDFVDVEGFATVYSGPFDCTDSVVTIMFSEPFLYTGGNLLIENRKTTQNNWQAPTFLGIPVERASFWGHYSGSFEDIRELGNHDWADFIPQTGFLAYNGCATPTLVAVTPGQNEAVVSWTENGSANNWLIKLDDGEWTEANSNPFTINGLNFNTEYRIRLRSLCGGGDTSFYTYHKFRTTCGVEPLPYVEDFESYVNCSTSFVQPYCWTRTPNNDLTDVHNDGSGGIDFLIRPNNIVSTPMLDLGGHDIFLSFDLNFTHSLDEIIAVGLTATPNDVENALAIDTIHRSPTATSSLDMMGNYQFHLENTELLETGYVFFKPLYTGPTSGAAVRIDNVLVTVDSLCRRPLDLTAVATDSTLTVTWREMGTAEHWLVQIDGGEQHPTDHNEYSFTGLTDNTRYEVTVRSLCSVGDTSNPTTTGFYTLCSTESLPFSEDFNAFYSMGHEPCWTDYDQPLGIYESSYNLNGDGMTVTPVLALDGEDLQISFDYKTLRTNPEGGMLAVGVVPLPALMDETVFLDTFPPSSTTFQRYDVVFRNTESLQTACVVFKTVLANLDVAINYVSIDNVYVALPTPSSLSATPTDNSLTITWAENGSATRWEVEVSGSEIAHTKGVDTYVVTTNRYTLTNLTPNTEYHIRVRAISNGGSSSDWSQEMTFATDAGGNVGIDHAGRNTSDPCKINIFPNPAGDYTTVSCEQPIQELTLCDINGRMLLTLRNCGTNAKFDTSALASGIYMMRVTTANGTTIRKLSVQ